MEHTAEIKKGQWMHRETKGIVGCWECTCNRREGTKTVWEERNEQDREEKGKGKRKLPWQGLYFLAFLFEAT